MGVEEEHEIAASGAQPLVERPPLGGVAGRLVVHDDDLGEVRIAGERPVRAASPPEPAHESQRRGEPAGEDHHAASAWGA